MKKDRKLYPYIEDFGKAVYGEYAHLAFASFNEESFIKDATEKITILQAQVAEMREVIEKIKPMVELLTRVDGTGFRKEAQICLLTIDRLVKKEKE